MTSPRLRILLSPLFAARAPLGRAGWLRRRAARPTGRVRVPGLTAPITAVGVA